MCVCVCVCVFATPTQSLNHSLVRSFISLLPLLDSLPDARCLKLSATQCSTPCSTPNPCWSPHPQEIPSGRCPRKTHPRDEAALVTEAAVTAAAVTAREALRADRRLMEEFRRLAATPRLFTRTTTALPTWAASTLCPWSNPPLVVASLSIVLFECVIVFLNLVTFRFRFIVFCEYLSLRPREASSSEGLGSQTLLSLPRGWQLAGLLAEDPLPGPAS